jgi:chemotaxis protein CheY-P-specific phosphatase CheC
MQDEVGAILGTEITLSDQDNRIVSKEDYFFDEASGKQILAHMDVVGDIEDHSYLYVGLKDAIFIGGTLIMLPPAELEIVVADEEFSDDTEDAYGEITNIIAGVYTSVFEEQYPKQLRFIKTGLEKVIPLKVDTESDTPMPDQDYYMSSAKLSIGANEMGKVQMLFPASLLELEQLGGSSADDVAEAEAAASAAGGISAKADGSGGGEQVGSVAAGGSSDPDFLIVSNNDDECGKITAILDEQNLRYRVLSHKDSVGDYLPGAVKAIFLLMTEVNENGMGVAIKISGISSLPLIAAGPEWTRSKVIKAVKYGVDDILLTPAASEDIAEKIRSVSASMAA